MYLRKDLENTKGDISKILNILNKTTAVSERPGDSEEGSTDVTNKELDWKHLHSEIKEDLLRVRRAFTDEKTTIKSAIFDLRETGTNLKSSIEMTMQAMTGNFEEMRTNLSMSARALEQSTQTQLDKTELWLNTMMNKSISEMLDTQRALEHSTQTYFDKTEQKLSTMVNKSLSEMLLAQENHQNQMASTIQTSFSNIINSLEKKFDKWGKNIDVKLAESQNVSKDQHYMLQQRLAMLNVTLSESISKLFTSLSGYYYGMQRENNVRLGNVSSENPQFGRLEVFNAGQWGTVCDDGFNNSAAIAACRMLGFDTGTAYDSAYKGKGSHDMPIWLDDLRCTGKETSIFLCPHRGLGVHNCGHHEDVAIKCFN